MESIEMVSSNSVSENQSLDLVQKIAFLQSDNVNTANLCKILEELNSYFKFAGFNIKNEPYSTVLDIVLGILSNTENPIDSISNSFQLLKTLLMKSKKKSVLRFDDIFDISMKYLQDFPSQTSYYAYDFWAKVTSIDKYAKFFGLRNGISVPLINPLREHDDPFANPIYLCDLELISHLLSNNFTRSNFKIELIEFLLQVAEINFTNFITNGVLESDTLLILECVNNILSTASGRQLASEKYHMHQCLSALIDVDESQETENLIVLSLKCLQKLYNTGISVMSSNFPRIMSLLDCESDEIVTKAYDVINGIRNTFPGSIITLNEFGLFEKMVETLENRSHKCHYHVLVLMNAIVKRQDPQQIELFLSVPLIEKLPNIINSGSTLTTKASLSILGQLLNFEISHTEYEWKIKERFLDAGGLDALENASEEDSNCEVCLDFIDTYFNV